MRVGLCPGTMRPMSQDPNQNRVGALSGTEAKTPLDRAKQIQELQRAFDSQPVAPQVQAQTPVAEVHVPVPAQKPVEVFDAKPVEQVNKLTNKGDVGADAALYAANQVDESSLFGVRDANSDVDVKGPVWKTIPFGPPQVAALADLKKPIENYNVSLPQKTVQLKEGRLFSLTLTPKAAGSEPAIKKAVITDDKGNIKGADFKSKGQLERALNEVPSFAMSLFQSVFGDGVLKDSPAQHHKIVSVDGGKKSAFEVKLERKNTIDGKWKTETVTLNNFGLKVPPSADPRRHDINVAMYYLDRFQAG